MRIIIVCDYFLPYAYGGDGVVSKYISSGLVNKGHNVLVVCTYRETHIGKNEGNVYRILTPKEKWISRRIWFLHYYFVDIIYLKRVINQFKPEIIYSLHQWGILPNTIKWLNTVQCPKVYRFGDEYLRLHYYKHIKSILTVDQAIVNTCDLKNRLSQYIRGDIIIIKNGINLDQFPFYHHNLKQKKQINLLNLGRMVEHKGILTILKFLREAIISIPTIKFQLTLAGPWPNKVYQYKILEFIKENNLNDFIRIIGVVDHNLVSKIYQNHDIFLFPSIIRDSSKTVEGCPNVLLESWASGIPVIARVAPGQAEILKNLHNSLTIESDNPNDYINMIKFLISESSLVNKITKNARELVEKEFGLNTMIEKTENILIKTINNWEQNKNEINIK